METSVCDVHWLGQIDYETAWKLQNQAAGEIAANKRNPTLFLLEHPHTFTLGKRAESNNILWDEITLKERGVTVRQADRGGDVTYHGPGQLVGYPILPLALPAEQGGKIPQADYVGYIRKLEETLILALEDFGILASVISGLTGVWVSADELFKREIEASQPAKIASIGVKVDARGMTRHGFALNVNPDMSYWEGIIPCGLSGVKMVSIENLIRPLPPMKDLINSIALAFAKSFNYKIHFVANTPETP
jgi:lipoyl(octanoyl) transferase